MTPADLDAIKARAKAREYVCEASQRDPVTGAYPPPCGAVATQRCVAGGDCGAWACDAHAAPFFAACDHRWERVDEGAEDIAALVAEVRRLRAIVEGREAAPTVTEALRVGAPRRATVRITDGTSRTFTAWPVREGWHHAPPCSESQPVYATPCDAALALARAIGLSVVDAVEVLP